MIYLVSYDLNTPGKDYRRLIDTIETYGNHCKVLKSQWLICSDRSAEEIFNKLVDFIDENDELLVCEINANRAYRFKPETMKQFEQLAGIRLVSGLLGSLSQQ